jgi:hypothetical protein
MILMLLNLSEDDLRLRAVLVLVLLVQSSAFHRNLHHSTERDDSDSSADAFLLIPNSSCTARCRKEQYYGLKGTPYMVTIT